MKNRTCLFALLVAASLAVIPQGARAWTPKPTIGDPLVHMPGTQPQQVLIQNASGCTGCHGAYDPNVEPGFLWQGSMMGQAARDPIFWSTFTVAAQDSIYVFGRPNATDTCERCHLPQGWLEGRSDPPSAAMMAGADFDGVQCDVCHRMIDPFFVDTASGAREGSDWAGYWDEAPGGMASSLAQDTATADASQVSTLKQFNGNPLYSATNKPALAGYTENSSGQYFVSSTIQARGPFVDAPSTHSRLYSRYHKSKYFCGTCHDLSGPFHANAAFKDAQPNDGTTVLPSESQPSHAYFPEQRTLSEFLLSDYGLPGGAPGTGAFAPGVFSTSRPGNAIAACQDCHMPSRVGKGCNTPDAKVRPQDSTEHPHSGQPTHDLTGGNALVPYLLASTVQGSPNYDAENAMLLGQGNGTLTLDLNAGMGIDPLALLAGTNRVLANLRRAAAISNVTYDPATGAVSFRIQNHTGHKLLTGYPEGRRMFVGITLFKAGAVMHQVNPYDAQVGTLKGLNPAESPSSPPLGSGEAHLDELVYEAHASSSITGEENTFHLALATGFSKDNRIPPRGFRIAEAAARHAVPALGGAPAPGLFTAAEYAGGYDEISVALPPGGDAVSVELYYQTTSREYIEFLRDEIKGTGKSLQSPTPSGEAKAYIIQSDPFFTKLKAWGDTLWQLWDHNKGVPGAAPILMTKASFVVAGACAGKADGTACDDGDACTTGDVCSGGACVGGGALGCDDQNPCTDDACDAQQGCVYSFNMAMCDDGNACTTSDVCAYGVCVPGPQLECFDTEFCTVDTCDPQLGCKHEPIPGCGIGSGGMGGMSGSGGGAATGSGGAGGIGGIGGMGGSGGGSSGGDESGCGCRAAGAADAASAWGAIGLLLGLGGLAFSRRRSIRRG